jgi:hypothetical protein
MVETTSLVVAGRKVSVPRLFKRLLQVALAVALTAGVLLVVIAGNGLLVGRTTFRAGVNAWLAFVQRPDILTTMVLTAFVTVLLVYWQRDQERKAGSGSRPSM